jgi:hypothetical protein
MQVIWRLFGQRPDLTAWRRRSLSPGVERGPGTRDRRDHYERVVAHEAPGPPQPDGPFRRLLDAVMSYRMFPPGLVEGVLERRPLRAGDTYGTCFHFLPGIDLFFAGRIVEVFDGPADGGWRAGFRLRTVRGHPMVGEETFCVRKEADGAVAVGMDSWSRPGLWLTWLAGPLLRGVQVRASSAALDHLSGVASRER